MDGGGTRGMFYPQGAYGPKAWGKHGPLTNPYAFGHIEHMRHDKKVAAGRIAFVLVRGIGEAFVANDVALDDVRRLLGAAAAA